MVSRSCAQAEDSLCLEDPGLDSGLLVGPSFGAGAVSPPEAHVFCCLQPFVATTKMTTCRGDQNDNKTIAKTITFGVKNGPCETLPTFDDLYLVLGIPDMSHCS